ncbi:MAG: CRISPR-associated endonuclease Cas2 [Spirochaetales bacterium]|nr:CRISPR-associated endonuclease Cas2 [Spirochaetales bacterium]
MIDDKRALLLYDIKSQSTYRKARKILDAYCSARIQKSAYEIIESQSRLDNLFHELSDIMKKETDRLALVTMCEDDWGSACCAGLPQSFRQQVQNVYIL